MQIIVLGMHRSGTSSVTRLLNLVGAYFGPEGMATDPNAENPKGFWERRDIRAVCDGLLQDSGFDWWRVADFSVDRIPDEIREARVDEFRKIVFHLDAHRPWVIKEPRLCLLMPVLRPVFEAPVFVHVVREPLEVAESLEARNGFPIPVGLSLWEVYTASAYAATVADPSVFVSYDALVRDPVRTTQQLVADLVEAGAHELHVPVPHEVTAFVETNLRRQRRDDRERDEYLNAAQGALARAADRLQLPDPSQLPKVSAGALATLRAFERAFEQNEAREAADLAFRAQSAEAMRDLEAAHQQIEYGLRVVAEEKRRAAQHAIESLSMAARHLNAVNRSGAVRMGARLAAARERLRGRRTIGVHGAIKRVLTELKEASTSLEEELGSTTLPIGTDEPVGELQLRRRAARARGELPKVAVLAWDVGHNPLGRAHLLADLLRDRFAVELWGAQFERYGSHVWLPLRGSKIPVTRFAGSTFPEFLETMDKVARRIDADAIYVSKPRFPSLGVGVLAKQVWNRPLIVDIDDFEPAFFEETEGLQPEELLRWQQDPDLALPFGRLWTRACEAVVGAADELTVSNPELEQRYGGVIVPHARDETVFDPARYDRSVARTRLGLDDSDRLILFGGTPRLHKGIVGLLTAVDKLGDDHIRVAAFGTRELDRLRKQIGPLERWLLPLPTTSFEALPAVIAAADLTIALQSPSHPVSRYQMPAKVTDAMAMGVPCLVTPVPPLQPLIDKDVVEVYDGDTPLHDRLREIFSDREEALDRARRARAVFLESYSYEAVRPVVEAAVERHLESPPAPAPALGSTIDVARKIFRPGASALSITPRRALPAGETYDLVVFWKQNDTGIYGRRQDMFLKYLERSGRFHTIVHFDHPMSAEGMWSTACRGIGTNDQNRLVVKQTLRRVVRKSDRGSVRNRTFVYSGGRMSRALGLPQRSQYADYVRSVLEREGVGVRPVVFWVYPASSFLPGLIDELAPDVVVADVVDDNRTWYARGTPGYDEVDRNYAAVLSRADVVLANCQPVAERMAQYTADVHVVPNACELPGAVRKGPRPREIADLRGPIIGYAGNLSGRIDLDLLRQLARARRDWNFVFVGSTHLDRSSLELRNEPNVRFLGTRVYDDAQAIIRHFDVALIPHLDNEMSRTMNPLKAYVYTSLGVPIVSSPVANLDALADFVTIANGPDEFVAAIERALQGGRREPDRDALWPHSWDVRVVEVLRLIDDEVERRRAGAG
jgi:glycosyltransferase involved in cell wall biosynthesis